MSSPESTPVDLCESAAVDREPRLSLLLIQDPPDEADVVRAHLEQDLPRAEIRVEAGSDAALARLAVHPVDLVLVHLSLPGGHAPAVVRAVRASHPDAVVLALSGPVPGGLALWMPAEQEPHDLLGGQDGGTDLAGAVRQAMEQRQAGREGLRQRQLAQGLLDAFSTPTCAVDPASRIVAVNQSWRDFCAHNGGTDETCGVGVGYLDICDKAALAQDGESSTQAAVVAQGIRDVLAGSRERFDQDYPCHSPTEDRWFGLQVTRAVIDDGPGAVITHSDVTDVHEIRLALAHQSLHDPLTDLPNRARMLEHVAEALLEAGRRGRATGLTHLDLHQFQQVNDRLGHAGGDALLLRVAERLRSRLRPGDVLARSSGVEFMVLWRDLDGPDQAVELSHGLLQELQLPFDLGLDAVGDAAGESVPVVVSASAGVAVSSAGLGVEELVRSADVALHEAGSRGHGHVVLFTEELRAAAAARRDLEADLALALGGTITQFVMHYQPVVDLASGNVVGVEALVRWRHPERGLLGPDHFIAAAETTGHIHPLGDWVLHRVVEDASRLTHDGCDLDVAVNFSVLQLDGSAAAKVRRALESSGLRPRRLVVEVTETALAEDERTAAAELESLSRLGVRIAIDDFGTGYSSMARVRRYPVDALKIDRQFVAGIGDSADDEAICASITTLAAAVGASTVGEGVETTAQYAVLRSLGCLQGQGYLWSPAVPIEELPSALAACDRVPVAPPRARMLRSIDRLGSEVMDIITRMQDDGASLHTIAAALNRSVGRHPSGVRWTARAVARARST